MLSAYIVAFCMYVFSALAAWALISAVNHLDSPESEMPHVEAKRQELKLAS